MAKHRVKGAARHITGNIDAAAGKFIGNGDAEPQAGSKMDLVVGAAYRVFADVKAAGRKGAGGKGFKTVSGLRY